MEKLVLCYIAFINVVAFIAFGVDKLLSKRGGWRISETLLLMLAVAGGSVGAWFGVGCWHHKTLHKKFRYGIPVIILLQLFLCCYLLREYIKMYINML
ncbi:MAG: DUF1294 domain-containing protein [Bacteroidaceae bacterium]|nr:DUF1294 domain-containing protein [Bacteroidaceae bacterium]